MASDTMMPTSASSTVTANSIVILWKRKSWMRWLRIVLRRAAWLVSGTAAPADSLMTTEGCALMWCSYRVYFVCAARLAAGTGVRAASRACSLALPERLAGAILHVGAPRVLHQLDDRGRHRHVVQLGGGGGAVLEGPVEELQHFLALGRVSLRLVHQDVGHARDRPAGLARLVRSAPRRSPGSWSIRRWRRRP